MRAVWGPDTAPRGSAAWRAQRAAVVGIVGVMLAVVALGAVHAIGTPPFAPPDETSHVGYALSLFDGVIPHIADFPRDTPIPGMRADLSLWTANHPPGSYLVLGIPLEVGIALDVPLAGFWMARMLNVIAVALAMVLVARIAATLLPHRPRVVLTATAVVGLVPYFIHIAGTAYTDGIALLPTLAIVAVAVHVLVRGPSRRALWGMVWLSAACALVRSQSLVVVFLAGAAYAVAVLLHTDGSVLARVRHGVLAAAGVGAAAVLVAGWFFVGNYLLYGDPSGSEALFDLHDREPRGTLWPYLTNMHHVRYQQHLLWGFIEGAGDGGRQFFSSGQWVANAWRLTVLVLGAAGVALGHRLARRRVDAGRIAAWSLLVLLMGVLYTLMIAFTANGGSPHPRYHWAGFPVVGIVLAVGLDTLRVPLPTRWASRVRVDALPLATFGALYALLQPQLHGWPQALEVLGVAPADGGYVGAVVDSFAARGLPAAAATGLIVLLAVGVALLVGGLILAPTHVDLAEEVALDAGGTAADRRPAAVEVQARGAASDPVGVTARAHVSQHEQVEPTTTADPRPS